MTTHTLTNWSPETTVYYKVNFEIGVIGSKLTIGHFSCSLNIQCQPIQKMVYLYETYYSNVAGGGAIQKYSDSLQKKWLNKITAIETAVGTMLPSLSLYNLTVDGVGNAYATSMVSVIEEGQTFNIMNIVHKFNTNGEKVWSNQFSIGNLGYSKNLAVSNDGEFLFAGMEYHSQIFKINAETGELISTGNFPLALTYWGEEISDINTVSFSHIKYGADGYLYVVQYHDNTIIHSDFVSKIDPSDGSLIWRFRGLPLDQRRTVYAIDINENGHVALGIGAGGESIYNTLVVLDSDMTVLVETKGAISVDLEPCKGIAIDNNDVVYFSGWSGGLTAYNIGTETKTTLVGLTGSTYPQFYDIALDNRDEPKNLFLKTVELASPPYNDSLIKYNIATGEVEWSYIGYAGNYAESGVNRTALTVQPLVYNAHKITITNRSQASTYNVGIKDISC